MLFTVLILNKPMKSNNYHQNSKINNRIHSLEVSVQTQTKEEHLVHNHKTSQIMLKQCTIQVNLNLTIIYHLQLN